MAGGKQRLLGALVAAALGISVAPGDARADRLPTPAECAAGTAAPLTLGEFKGAAALCAGPVYVGGNPTYPCGTVLVGDTPVTGTPEDDPATSCDSDDPLDSVLRFTVALPPTYAKEPKRRWPTIYLLPGGGGDEHSWTSVTTVVPALTRLGAIVVLPYGGTTFHTNWEIGERRAYETAFVQRLMPHIDATYRTLAAREHRAIGGFSRGGYGAMLITARHPDLFGAAGSFSGALDSLGQLREQQLYIAGVTAPGRYDEVIGTAPWFGDPVTNELGWRERNPVDLARALFATDIWVTTGNGVPVGPQASDPLFALGSVAEAQVNLASRSFHDALTKLGIPHVFEVHDGLHDYVTAGADVLRWATHLAQRSFTYRRQRTFNLRNADPTFGAFGWTFTADRRRAAEFLDVTNAGRDGVVLTGSGWTRVVTPSMFPPGRAVGVEIGASRFSATAGRDGRLRLMVDLGPPHSIQQFTPGAALAQQRASTVTVRFQR